MGEKKMQLLSDAFINKYPDHPDHMNELAKFVFYRTYSRWLPNIGRRETWREAVRRAVEYNVGVSVKQFDINKYQAPLKQIVMEAEALFDNIFNTRQFLSGRTHWVGGASTGVANKFPLANFNCSFLNIKSWDDLGDLFYLLLVGTGVGFKSTKEMASNMPPIRSNASTIHSEYKPLPKAERIESTQLHIMNNGYAKIWVGDSKEGWVEALRTYLRILTQHEYESIHTIKISYNSIRPKGERLRTFGGTASGYEPLMEMFDGFDKVLKNQIDPHLAPLEINYEMSKYYADARANHVQYVQVRPIHILDMGNLIGNNVVVGGVRRTAEIFLCDEDDWECILAKYGINGIWNDGKHHGFVIQALENLGVDTSWMYGLKLNDENTRPLHHRRMSNNSIGFTSKPSREMLNLIFTIMQGEGEPGFVNLEEANRRRPNAEGLNPCAEILLDSYGVCNLTTINVDAFVKASYDESDGKTAYTLDYSGLMEAQALSARAGLRMTLLDLELPHWDSVQKRDRLLGTSLTGWQDAMEKLRYNKEQQEQILALLHETARGEAERYARIMRVPAPVLVTTVKPEGTLSQVAGGVSSGLHYSHAPYYIRRIRINAHDPLAKVAVDLGWNVNPEVGQDVSNPRTLVIDFPVFSGAEKTKDDVSVKEQFDTYFMFQECYTEHNSSNTITVKPDEWEEAEQIVWDNWDGFCGVSFLANDGGSYELAPYEAITKEQYEEMRAKMKPFDAKLLESLEVVEVEIDQDASGCETGICPIR
jgi:ribonucleoside-triphosphate reductase